MQSLFKVVHVGPLATGIQSLMLLYQVMESHQGVSTRYYQALYAKLLDPRLKHSGKQVKKVIDLMHRPCWSMRNLMAVLSSIWCHCHGEKMCDEEGLTSDSNQYSMCTFEPVTPYVVSSS